MTAVKGRIPGNGPFEELTTIRKSQPGRTSGSVTVESQRDALQGKLGVPNSSQDWLKIENVLCIYSSQQLVRLQLYRITALH